MHPGKYVQWAIATILFYGCCLSLSAQSSGSDTAYLLRDTVISYDSASMTETIMVRHFPVFKKVDTLPSFKLCSTDPDPQECSKKYLLDCLYNYIQYPDTAKKSKVQGVVFASFVVDEVGERCHAKITRGLGYGCDEEVLRFISVLPPMLPARRKGQNVAYEYSLPVKFQLKK